MREMRNELRTELCNEIKREMSVLNKLIQENINVKLKEDKGERNSTQQNSEIENQISAQNKTKHTISIEPNDESNTNFSEAKWNEAVKNAIEPKLKKIPVTKIIRSKNGKGILFFPNAEARNKAAETLKDEYKLERVDKNIKKLFPKVKVSWIPKTYFTKLDKTSLRESILSKNPTVNKLVNEDNKMFELIFISDEKDKDFSYAIIKVDPCIKDEIQNVGNRLYIGLSSCKVSERYHILQCYKCQRFGHKRGSKQCPLDNSDEETCLYCASNHLSKNCPSKSQTESFKCSNCKTSKDPKCRANYTGHTSTNRNCPMLQQALKLVMDRTTGTFYKPNIQKNLIST